MPILLAPDQAPLLTELIEAANVAGLPVTLPQVQAAQRLRVQGLGSLDHASQTEISFLSNSRLAASLLTTRAGAVVLTEADWQSLLGDGAEVTPTFVPVLCDAPYALYAMLAQWFDQHRLQQLPAGIHPTAIIHPSAQLADGVAIGPHCVVEADVHIGAGTRLGAHAVVGQGSRIGADCLLHARVTLYHRVNIGQRCIVHSGAVLGADGFGFAPDPRDTQQSWIKIAQLGSVTVGNDVEIGANTTIDRGALDNTTIADGVKLDNQIMIGHNCQVGEHTAMAACVGVAGSTRIGARCTIGGAAMLSGHLVLGDDVHVSGGTAVTSDIATPGRYTGVYPYADHRNWKKNTAVVSQLAAIRRRLRQLEQHFDLSSRD